MNLPNPKDAIHKAWLYRLLSHLADNAELMQVLYFKGGTCASMLGYLDRFSVDLDFDAKKLSFSEMQVVRNKLETVILNLGLEVKQQSKAGIQYICKYEAAGRSRNTIKLEVNFPAPESNLYTSAYFPDIDRSLPIQTKETMFANKLVAVLDRWEKHQSIAGRDVYDIHHFFLQGYRYHAPVIQERWKKDVKIFFEELIGFIQTHINQTVLQQDLNFLLPHQQFRQIMPTLKQETLMFLKDELKRLVA